MPSGKVHAATTIAMAVAAPLLIAPSRPAIMAAGCLAGLILSPDLDIERPTHAHSVIAKAGSVVAKAGSKIAKIGGIIGKIGFVIAKMGGGIGELLAFLWWGFWWPYGRLIPHRSLLSHAPIIGTLGRLLYLFFFPMLIWWLLSLTMGGINTPQFVLPQISEDVYQAILGLVIVDTLHGILDWIF